MALKTVSALLAALILCSCARPVSDKYPSDTGGASGTASSVSSSRVETTEAAPSETSKTEPSQPPQQDNTTSQTSADESDSIDAPAPESEFYLPEEFFESLNEIFDKYSINQNCDPGSDPCGCVPEYEEMGEDGSVIVPRDRVVSIYFLDTQSGYELSVNPGVHFPVASTVKIPFCVYIYQKLTDGEIDPNLSLIHI